MVFCSLLQPGKRFPIRSPCCFIYDTWNRISLHVSTGSWWVTSECAARGEELKRELMSSVGNSWGREKPAVEEKGCWRIFLPCVTAAQAGAHVCCPHPQRVKGSCTECYTRADLQGEKFLSHKADLISWDHMLACLFPKEPTISCGKNSEFYWLSEKRELEMLAK